MAATKVTLTLPEDLLVVVDSFVAEHRGMTRSGVCAEALRDWLRARQEEKDEWSREGVRAAFGKIMRMVRFSPPMISGGSVAFL